MPTFEQEQAARRSHILNQLSGSQPTGLTCERCGREIVLMSPASPGPTCAGCGFPGELCRCQPPGEQES